MTDEVKELSLLDSWRLWWDYEITRPAGGGPIARFSQIYQRWDVLRELIIRGLKSTYGGNFLGYAWTLFTPLALIGVYWMVFGHVVNLGLTHYPLFIAAGMMPWIYFNSTVNSSMGSLRSNSGVIRTINLPREIFPLSVVGEGFVEYLASLPVVFVLGFAYGVFPSRYLVFLPVSALIETVLLVGIALLLSAFATVVRDTQRVMRPILRVLFYLTPTLYPLSKVHGSILLTLYKLDPLVGVIELQRLTWYPHYTVPPAVVFQHAAVSAFDAIVLLIIGYVAFTRIEARALKEL